MSLILDWAVFIKSWCYKDAFHSNLGFKDWLPRSWQTFASVSVTFMEEWSNWLFSLYSRLKMMDSPFCTFCLFVLTPLTFIFWLWYDKNCSGISLLLALYLVKVHHLYSPLQWWSQVLFGIFNMEEDLISCYSYGALVKWCAFVSTTVHM